MQQLKKKPDKKHYSSISDHRYYCPSLFMTPGMERDVQKPRLKYDINAICYCKFSSFSNRLKCHPQSLPPLIHHVNLMSSSRAIHQSLTIALFCSCTHYRSALAACHKHSVFYRQSEGKGKYYANTKWRTHLSCALKIINKLVLKNVKTSA